MPTGGSRSPPALPADQDRPGRWAGQTCRRPQETRTDPERLRHRVRSPHRPQSRGSHCCSWRCTPMRANVQLSPARTPAVSLIMESTTSPSTMPRSSMGCRSSRSSSATPSAAMIAEKLLGEDYGAAATGNRRDADQGRAAAAPVRAALHPARVQGSGEQAPRGFPHRRAVPLHLRPACPGAARRSRHLCGPAGGGCFRRAQR